MGVNIEIIKSKGYLIKKYDFDLSDFILDLLDRLEHPVVEEMLKNIFYDSYENDFWFISTSDKQEILHKKVGFEDFPSDENNPSAIALDKVLSPMILNRNNYQMLRPKLDIDFLNIEEKLFLNKIITDYAYYGEYLITVYH